MEGSLQVRSSMEDSEIAGFLDRIAALGAKDRQ